MYSNNLQFPYCIGQLKVFQGKLYCAIHTSNDPVGTYFKENYLGDNYICINQCLASRLSLT